MPNLLLIAYHFPPAAASSGVQRVLSIAETLPRHGWNVTVLTAHARAYPPGPTPEPIPTDVRVIRAQAWDAARHFSLFQRYPSWLAEPDRWMSWYPDAVRLGRKLAARGEIDAVMSTYPIATAHRIAGAICRASKLPWIADFRDPMTDTDYPPPGRKREQYQQIEQQAGRQCTIGLVTSPSLLMRYQSEFPASEKWRLILNGYREEAFAGLDPTPKTPGPFLLLHSGVIYPSERDPTALFQALAALKRETRLGASQFLLRLRAPGHIDWLHGQLAEYKIQDLVEVAPALPYRQALAEMQEADGLLIMQASNCNAQVPAKTYEYLRAQRPILALTDPAGDTAATLRDIPCSRLARLDDANDIATSINSFISDATKLGEQALSHTAVSAYSRTGQAAKLASYLDELYATRKRSR